MTSYIVTGTDYTDEGAFDRRMQAREEHLTGARRLKASGVLLFAGAFLNDAGKMAGSTMVVQFEDYSELEAWLAQEPYLLTNVWETVDVKEIKIPNL